MNNITDNVSKIADKASNAANDVKDAIGGQPSSSTVANAKGAVATGLATAAQRVHDGSDTAETFLNEKVEKAHELAQTAVGKVNSAGHRTANVIASSADYIRDLDLSETRQQIKGKIADRPELSIAIAGLFGIALGLLLGRKSKR